MQSEYRHKTKVRYADLPDLEAQAEAVQVVCTNCAEVVPASDLNINDMIAKCQCCDSIFSIKKIVSELQAKTDSLYTDEIGRPEGIELNYFHNEFEITARQPLPIFDIIMACSAPLFLFIGLGLFFGDGAIIGLPVATISAIVLVWSIVKLIRSKSNRVYVTINDHSLDVAYRPKNFVKDQSFLVSEIEQAFVKADPVMGGHAVYLVINDPNGQSQKRLMGGMKSLLKAKYIEQELERKLGITNKKVSGEIS